MVEAAQTEQGGPQGRIPHGGFPTSLPRFHRPVPALSAALGCPPTGLLDAAIEPGRLS